jgi:hypothetical protein
VALALATSVKRAVTQLNSLGVSPNQQAQMDQQQAQQDQQNQGQQRIVGRLKDDPEQRKDSWYDDGR